jgi:formylglycine-generating enzyme required for sulfatase activity/nitrate/TMAO reductase-like tetraheme cytochrome c subunit
MVLIYKIKLSKIIPLFKKSSWILITGVIIGIFFTTAMYKTSVFFSTDKSCMSCHIHPHAEESWMKSVHVNNSSGVKVHCVSCHLPPQDQTWKHYTAKARLGIRDVWAYATKDSSEINWEEKSLLENAIKYIPNSACVDCHQNLFPKGITEDGVTAHLYYEKNEKKLDLQCISCHLDSGHENPNYKHGKLEGIYRQSKNIRVDTSMYFKAATEVLSFTSYIEKVPGTAISISMKAIPGGTFKMGSPESESFHAEDEGPIRNVTVSPFYMSEFETTWKQYWCFFENTMSEGRIPPSVVYDRNTNPDVDAFSGPTPPYGKPDQGWGTGNRPAITMTPYAAEIYCLWLSKKTGKKYRLPTEAEWEYAARAGTETPYFFSGNPTAYSDKGFWRNFFDASTDTISNYVIYKNNTKNRTQEPSAVKANPFGLKNMLGNVMEFCADKYNPEAYSKTSTEVKDPLETNGDEYVIRGGNYASDAANLRSASRSHTMNEDWLKTDPQQPKSLWWYSDFRGIGFRIVCEPANNISDK